MFERSGSEEQGLNSTHIHGHTVYYSDEAHEGVKHLKYDLQQSEILPYFTEARMHGQADFEDDREGQFTLEHEGDKYILRKR